MKHISIFCFFLYSYAAQCQVSEGLRSMSQGNNNALVVSLVGVSQNDAEKIWKKYMDGFGGKSKFNKKSGELFTDNASLPTISENTVDVYGKAEKLGDDIIFASWFDLGGAYLSNAAHPERYKAGSDIMIGFLKEIERFKISESLKVEERKLDKLNGNLKDLVRTNESLAKDIKKAEEKIADAKLKIEQNTKDQAAKQSEIDAQKALVDGVKSNLEKI